MGYAVYHAEKGKISSGGIGAHIDRAKGFEHTYRHADPALAHLNRSFEIKAHCNKLLHVAVSDRIGEGYTGKKAIRKDAVRYQTHVLTGSHQDMHRIFSNPDTADAWIKANMQFMADEFGRENIVRFVLHRDEKTPHLHVVTVPLTQDGRLSAKEIMGNRKAMQLRQDRYAEAMQAFGLQRGIRNTGIKHESAKEYYARIEEAMKEARGSEITLSKDFLGRYKKESVDKLEDVVKSLKIALKSKEDKVLQFAKDIEQTSAKHEYQIQGLTEKLQQAGRKIGVLLHNDNERRRLLQIEFNKQLKKLSNDVYRLGQEGRGDKNQGIDELIRKHMREVNPEANPWETLKRLGSQEKIQEHLSQTYDEGKRSIDRGMRR